MNRLANESSPYLRQHAGNPVDWFPWGAEAFRAAEKEGKPILLSVGYSACHWCHVMAHESFEDETTAKLMNELFVNIKVDREERPDVDAVYMEATQAISGQGGWPMTVFLTPDGRPFFAGTYYPPVSQAGRPGFVDLLRAVNEAWTKERDHVEQQATQLREAIEARTRIATSSHDMTVAGAREVLDHAYAEIETAYDPEWGGFGRAPKFPQATTLELLLRSTEPSHREMAINTLDAMASGGIYDHVGGGFHRYSVDPFWMVPHFEKMLYDQATLATLYIHAFQATGEQRYRQIAEETIEYVRRDLASSSGGWCSAEDADSEGEEGLFYIWRPEAIDTAIGTTAIDAAIESEVHIRGAAKQWYGVTQAGNFEGSNILHRPVRGDLIRPAVIETARQRLLDARAQRVRPELDDKVLTEWNAMFISALCQAGSALQRHDWIVDAERAADFLISELRDEHRHGRWHRSWHPSSGPRHLAYANDYAWLVDAFTRLAESTGKAHWRAEAIRAADDMLRLFWDEKDGGLFTTADDAEELVVRTKDIFDSATASANSTAAVALLRLGALMERGDFTTRAERILALVGEPMTHHPAAFTNFLAALEMTSVGLSETVITGTHPELIEWTQSRYLPNNVLLWGERDDSPLWNDRLDGAFVCKNQTCGPRATTIEDLARQLGSLQR